MLKDADLPLEFWDEAAQTEAYLRNKLVRYPIIQKTKEGQICERQISPEEAWSGKMPTIKHLRTFGCQAFSYVDPNSHPPGPRTDKFIDRGREGVFMGYN